MYIVPTMKMAISESHNKRSIITLASSGDFSTLAYVVPYMMQISLGTVLQTVLALANSIPSIVLCENNDTK